jgi:hypothetical protein
MYKKYLITGIILLLSIGQVFSQDTSKNSKNNQVSLIPFTDPNPDSARVDRNINKPHAEINLMGASVPGTTSGTLGSSVNPNTGFVIPFGGNKKKPDSK